MGWPGFAFSHSAFVSSTFLSAGRMAALARSKWTDGSSVVSAKSSSGSATARADIAAEVGDGAGRRAGERDVLSAVAAAHRPDVGGAMGLRIVDALRVVPPEVP